MKNRKLIATILTALMLFICSATAFAEDMTVPETEFTTITEVADTSNTDNITQIDAESATNEDNEGVTVIREEVTLESAEPAETEIVIDTSDVSITQGEPENSIIVDYADTYTDIPTTGSSKVVAVIPFAAVCTALIGVIVTKKRTQ